MVRKPPKLEHVRWPRSKGKTYPYFNTGQKKPNGKPILVPLPQWGSVGFFDSYNALKSGRTKRLTTEYTVASLARDYLASTAFTSRRPNTQKAYRQHLDNILDAFAKVPVNSLEPSHVNKEFQHKEYGWGMHNGFLAVLGAMYTWGRKNTKTTGEPTKDVERRTGNEWEPWPEHVLEAALASDDDAVRFPVHLFYFTGQRIGDVCAMRWNDIRDGVMTIVQEKTRKEVDIPIHSELRAELDRMGKRGITILTAAKGGPMNPRDLRITLKAFVAKHGAPSVVPHGLRKNAVNALIEAGCTVAEVAAITGQSFAIVEKYARRMNRKKLGKAAMLKFETTRRKSV